MAGALQPRNGSLQKPRNTSRTLSMLGQYMLHSAPLLILALVLSIVGNVFQLIGPALCGRAIDAASGGKGQVDFQTVYYYALQMIVFYVASAALAPGTTDRAADQPAYGTVDAWGSFLQTDALACEVL